MGTVTFSRNPLRDVRNVLRKNAVYPGTKVRPLLVRSETFERLHVRFLYEVFGLVPILREPLREVVQRGKQGHRQFLEGLGDALVCHVS
jgi:hypothetical protein